MERVENLVWETTEGTSGPYTLTTVARSFNDAFGTGGTDTFWFGMYNQGAAGEWMVASGHLSASSTLVVDTVKEGSNGTSEPAWSAGRKNIVNATPAKYQHNFHHSDAEPSAAESAEWDFWLRTTDGALFVKWDDGDSVQWVQVNGGGGSRLTPAYAFASIPSQFAVTGAIITITDSSTATWGATISGSGANTVLAWYNGSNWTVVGA